MSNNFQVDNKKECLIIVNSPYQALCAIEAINYFEIQKYQFIACVSGDVRDKQLFNFFKQKNLSYGIFNYRNKINIIELIKTFFFSYEKYGFSIICDRANLWNKIVALYYLNPDADVIFSDDGNNTMSFLQGKDARNRKIKDYILNITLQVVLRKKKINFSDTFFTVYADVAQPKYRCYLNSFAYFTKRMDKSIEHKNVYIVGTNIKVYCEKLNLGLAEYSDYLSSLFRYIKTCYNEELIYIPHGRDSLPMAKGLCEQYGIKYNPVKTIVELYIIDEKKYPVAVFGYTSTCLLNFKKLFPDSRIVNVCCHKLKDNIHQEEYESFSKYFDMHGIERINQNEI